MINDYFDKIYCLNLLRRQDRWSECINLFLKYQMAVSRFDAVDSKNVLPTRVLNRGEHAVIQSTINIFNDAIDNQYDKILILEDDVDFLFNLDNFDKHMASVPTDYDMLYFGGNHMDRFTYINDKIVRISNTLCSHSIAFKKSMYGTIVEMLKKKEKTLDRCYADLQKQHVGYCFYPGMMTQRPSFSDIQNLYVDYRHAINKMKK